MLSSCGIQCNECDFFGQTCNGCPEVKGKPFWVKEMQVENCALYNCCANEKSLPHCGHCSELPCTLFKQYKDPSMSDEEHAQSMQLRIERLRVGV